MVKVISIEWDGLKSLQKTIIRYLEKKKLRRNKMVDMIIAYLKSNKDEIIDGINRKVNIPLVSEAKEEEIFESEVLENE